MNAVSPSRCPDQPLQAIEDAHERALEALADPDTPTLDAVVWLSVHLAAVQHVVQPEFSRFFDGPIVRTFRRGAGRIERTLRTLEQLESGDALVSNVDETRVLHALVAQVGAQADLEHRLLDQLAERLSPDEQRRLVAEYQCALAQAPTRPHPHAPHGPVLGGLAFRVNGPRDHVMDTLDSRHIPTPHRPRKPVQ